MFSGLLVDLLVFFFLFFSFLSVVLKGNVLPDKIKHAVGREYVSDEVLRMEGKQSDSLL